MADTSIHRVASALRVVLLTLPQKDQLSQDGASHFQLTLLGLAEALKNAPSIPSMQTHYARSLLLCAEEALGHYTNGDGGVPSAEDLRRIVELALSHLLTSMDNESADPVEPEGHVSFIQGVRLFDDLFEGFSDNVGDPACYLVREGEDADLAYKNVTAPFVRELVSKPALADGFAAALGDFLAMIGEGVIPNFQRRFEDLQLEDLQTPEVIGCQSTALGTEVGHG